MFSFRCTWGWTTTSVGVLPPCKQTWIRPDTAGPIFVPPQLGWAKKAPLTFKDPAWYIRFRTGFVPKTGPNQTQNIWNGILEPAHNDLNDSGTISSCFDDDPRLLNREIAQPNGFGPTQRGPMAVPPEGATRDVLDSPCVKRPQSLHSPGPGKGITNRGKIKPEAPNNIEHKLTNNQE